MSIDTLVRGVERKLSVQSALLDLGNAWMDKTDGIVIDEVHMDEQEYASALKRIPLWGRVKDNLPLYSKLLQGRKIRDPEHGQEARLLFYFPKLLYVFDDFLDDPIYSPGKIGQIPLSFPLTFSIVLNGYVARERKIVWKKGDCKTVFRTIESGNLKEEMILDSLGLKDRWEQYQNSRKLPNDIREELESALDHFLSHPLYSDGKGGERGSLGSPFSLRTVLLGYVPGKGLRKRSGQCRKVYFLLQAGHAQEEFVLDSVGLREQWEAYQKTKGLPEDIRERTKALLERFLDNPLYSSGKSKQGTLGSPLPLRTVLRNFTLEGMLDHNKGEMKLVYQAIVRNVITEKFVLDSVGLSEQWETYQKTRQFPEEIATPLRQTLEHFLRAPLYSTGKRQQGKKGQPLPLKMVLHSYHNQSGEMSTGKGDCHTIYRMIYNGHFTEDYILDRVALTQQWKDYQQSTGAKPFIFPARGCTR